MTAIDAPTGALTGAPPRFRFALDRLARAWGVGSVSLTLPDRSSLVIGQAGTEPHGALVIRDWRCVGRCLMGGDVGFADGYMAGEWDSPDLAALLRVMALNFDDIKQVSEGGLLMRGLGLLVHFLRGNTAKGARRNIEAHYDLGNAFYGAWLDEGMTYSSALYVEGRETLETAQAEKYRALARTIELQPGHDVLEIGCGWGGFAEIAAKEFGARVVGLTLSPSQCDYARKRMFEQGLAERVEIRLTDYRQVEGRFDRIASIEMFEAVGERYWDAFFNKVAASLKPGGVAGLQVITIEDALFDSYRQRMDFIQAYIFPGGMLPSIERFEAGARASGLTPAVRRRFGPDYARTLAEWLIRFDAAWPTIRDQGFDERFRRLWRFYLAYCEAGFSTGRTDVIQATLRAA